MKLRRYMKVNLDSESKDMIWYAFMIEMFTFVTFFGNIGTMIALALTLAVIIIPSYNNNKTDEVFEEAIKNWKKQESMEVSK